LHQTVTEYVLLVQPICPETLTELTEVVQWRCPSVLAKCQDSQRHIEQLSGSTKGFVRRLYAWRSMYTRPEPR